MPSAIYVLCQIFYYPPYQKGHLQPACLGSKIKYPTVATYVVPKCLLKPYNINIDWQPTDK
jgi:hypothetical protein